MQRRTTETQIFRLCSTDTSHIVLMPEKAKWLTQSNSQCLFLWLNIFEDLKPCRNSFQVPHITICMCHPTAKSCKKLTELPPFDTNVTHWTGMLPVRKQFLFGKISGLARELHSLRIPFFSCSTEYFWSKVHSRVSLF